MQDIFNRLERALKQVVDAGGFGVTVFKGQTNENQVRPSFTVHASDGREIPLGSGNWMMDVVCQLRSNANDTDEEVHRVNAENMFSPLMFDNLQEQLTATGHLYVFAPIINRNARNGREDDCWLSELFFSAYCCLQNLA